MTSSEKRLLGLCFFLSGATSLVLEVAWSKELSYILGNTLYAVATVVAAFMAGLAVGAALASVFAARVRRPLAAYAIIQVVVGVCGMLSIPAFRATEPVLRALYRSFEPTQGAFLLARFAVVFALMLVPAILMGITLPLVVGAFARRKERYAFEAGVIYGVNTLGAVTGTLAAGFFLLERLGIQNTCVVVGVIDVLLGVVALLLDRKVGAIEDVRHQRPVGAGSLGWTRRQWTVGVVYAASGLLAMAYEVAWFRLLGLTMGPTVYAFSAMLALFLLGIGIGSAVSARYAETTRLGGVGAMALLETLLGIVGLVSLQYYNALPTINLSLFRSTIGAFGALGFVLGQMGVAALVLLAPCLILGALFPVAVRAVRESGETAAPEVHVGRLYLLNTAGGIVGTLAAGFWALPSVGVEWTLRAASVTSAALGALLWLLAHTGRFSLRAGWAALSLLTVVVLAWVAPVWDVALFNQGLYRRFHAASAADRLPGNDTLIYYREGINSPVAVFTDGENADLRVTGKTDASTAWLDLPTQFLVGHLPVLFAAQPRHVAVLGYGSGMSVASVLTHPGVESVDVFEIEEAVIEASPLFDCINHDPFDDPRTRLILEDGRVFLTYTDKTYDVITSEPSNPWMAGVSNLFTVDFYRTVQSRLAPDGVLGQWIQMYDLSEETFKVILASIHEVFAHLVVFRTSTSDVVVLASARPIQIPYPELAVRFAKDSVRASFAELNIHHPLDLAFYLHAPEAQSEELVRGTSIRNSDDNVWLEHRMPRDLIERSDMAKETRIGNSLISLAATHRLRAIQKMIPQAPLAEVVNEILSYQYAMEPMVLPPGVVVDPWAEVRPPMVRGMHDELQAMGEVALALSVERASGEGERRLESNRVALQRLNELIKGGTMPSRDAVEEIVATAPDLSLGTLMMATLLYAARDDEAEAYYRRLATRPYGSAHYHALVGLGNVAARRGDIRQAVSYYERAIAYRPYPREAFRNLSVVYQRTQQPALARQTLAEALRFHPADREFTQTIATLR